MKQKADSLEKQHAHKSGRYEPQDRSGDGLRAHEQTVDARADVSARFQTIPIEACLNSATAYDPDVNYAIVLASVLAWIEARDAQRTGRRAHPTA